MINGSLNENRIKMKIEDFKDYLINNVPNFETPKIIEEGECYHYTIHWDKIKKENKFKGAEINNNLDRTQRIKTNETAQYDIGIVFGYEKFDEAIFEGNNADIIKIRYKKAISSLHKAEADSDAIINQAKAEGHKITQKFIDMVKNYKTPKTILILTTDIISFEFIQSN